MCDIRLFCYDIHWYICFKTLSKLNIPFFVNIPSTKLLNKCDEKGLVFKGATAISLSELYLNILISLTNHFKKQLRSIKHGKFYTEFLSLNQNKYYTSLSWKFQHQQMFKIFKIKKYRAKNRFKKCAMSSLQICFFYYIVPPVNFLLATKCFLSNTYYIDSFYLFLMYFSFSIFQVKDIFHVFKVFRYQRETL